MSSWSCLTTTSHDDAYMYVDIVCLTPLHHLRKTRSGARIGYSRSKNVFCVCPAYIYLRYANLSPRHCFRTGTLAYGTLRYSSLIRVTCWPRYFCLHFPLETSVELFFFLFSRGCRGVKARSHHDLIGISLSTPSHRYLCHHGLTVLSTDDQLIQFRLRPVCLPRGSAVW